MAATLLVELLTEELPPKSLRQLSEAFKDRLLNELVKFQLKNRAPDARAFATPRRLAVLIPNVEERGTDRSTEVSGPAATAPEAAIAGFARKHGVKVGELGRQQGAKGEVVVARVKIPGAVLAQVLPNLVEEALAKLPIPKVMRWGASDAQFVRPVHGLVMLHGSKVVEGKVLGLASSGRTHGHRFMGKGEIALRGADSYEAQLRDEGMVVASFEARKAEIEDGLKSAARKENSSLGTHEDLLDEWRNSKQVASVAEQPHRE